MKLCYIRLVNKSITIREPDDEAYRERMRRLGRALYDAQITANYERQQAIIDAKRRLRTSYAVIKAQCVLGVAEYNMLALYFIGKFKQQQADLHGISLAEYERWHLMPTG